MSLITKWWGTIGSGSGKGLNRLVEYAGGICEGYSGIECLAGGICEGYSATSSVPGGVCV